MNRQSRIGLLPLYLKLYDDTFPELRYEFDDPLIKAVLDGFEREGVETVMSGICRLAPEFRKAIRHFEQEDVDLIVTLHLAYSLSLESIDALAAANRPILMLDTTLDYDFGPAADPARILYNHGIHGVQDLASLLVRRKVPFEIVAGHIQHSNVLRRAAELARAAHAARCFKNTPVLRVGESFAGMGDFAVDEELLWKQFRIAVDTIAPDALADSALSVTDKEIEAELQADRQRFVCEAPEEVHRRSLRVGLGLRRYLEKKKYRAFSQNFLAFASTEGPVDTVPFLECSKAMERGVGYAGEGDVLTAALVGALQGGFGKTTFTEMFCPDWKGDAIFLSHMGEINPEVAAGKAWLIEKDFPWTPAKNPAMLACAPATGPAVLVNLAPGPDDTFRLILAPVEVLGDTTRADMREAVRGWIRPQPPVEPFLEEYSRRGGTHHCALVLGDHAEAVAAMGSYLGMERTILAR
ncbi:MAG: hypothetical protein ACE15F_11540 [bacterium]